jgi:DNA-damage-inducible protein J
MARVKAQGADIKPRAKTDMIRVRVDPVLRVKAEAVLGKLGLSASDAIRLFYSQIALRDGLPFEVRLPNATTRKALREADAGVNLAHYDSVDEMFQDLGS